MAKLYGRSNGARVDKNPATIEQWNKGLIPVLCAHPASAGHGLNLQYGSNILAYFSSGWNLEEDQQILERIGPTRQFQAGLNREVYVHRIHARGTIDSLVAERLEGKKSVQEILLEAMKRRSA
jgi:SNF2 family DNA or RNA helicase